MATLAQNKLRTYEKRRPRIRGLEWDGTRETALAIAENFPDVTILEDWRSGHRFSPDITLTIKGTEIPLDAFVELTNRGVIVHADAQKFRDTWVQVP